MFNDEYFLTLLANGIKHLIDASAVIIFIMAVAVWARYFTGS